MKRAEALSPPHRFPRGYCREGHPILRRTMLGGVGDLTALCCSKEQGEFLERQSLEIFTLMANAGYSFAECLAAVLLSGMNWGANALTPSPSEKDSQ